MEGRVSVVMGAYNCGDRAMLRAAVRSVLAQSLPPLEVVVCDDGSTDDTFLWLSELAAEDARVRVLRAPRNEGLASALNRCVRAARGDLIARQDADDLSRADRFERQVGFLAAHPEIAFVGSAARLFDAGGAYAVRRYAERPAPRDFLFNNPFFHGSLVFRRACLDRAGLYRADRGALRAEDYDLLMRLYALGFSGANLPETLYDFREDAGAAGRRRYRYRVIEARVRFRGFRAMGLMPAALPWAVKPLVVGLLPAGLLHRARRRHYGDAGGEGKEGSA